MSANTVASVFIEWTLSGRRLSQCRNPRQWSGNPLSLFGRDNSHRKSQRVARYAEDRHLEDNNGRVVLFRLAPQCIIDLRPGARKHHAGEVRPRRDRKNRGEWLKPNREPSRNQKQRASYVVLEIFA